MRSRGHPNNCQCPIDKEPAGTIAVNGYQIKRLLDFVDSEDEAELTLQYVDHERPDGNSNDGEMMPKGLYAWFTEYPDEGSLWLPETPEEHAASVEPRSQSDRPDNSDENCPKCGTLVLVAPGIGPYCPNSNCDVIDNLLQVPTRPLPTMSHCPTCKCYESDRPDDHG